MSSYFKYFFVFCLISGFFSCKKENKQEEEENQGTNFSRLLKTVMKGPNLPYDQTVNYSYNSTGQLSEISFESKDLNSGRNYFTSEKFFRNSTGRLDSISYKTISIGEITYYTRTVYSYGVSGNLNYSIFTNDFGYGGNQLPVIDSSLYTYSGTRMTQRTDYRKFNTDPYTLLRIYNYDYDPSGNLTIFRSAYTTHPGLDTVFLSFDTKTNSLPALRNLNEVYHWGPAFYNDYSFINNPISKRTKNSNSFDYEYRYTPNNKPLFQKIKEVNSPWYADVYFYYD